MKSRGSSGRMWKQPKPNHLMYFPEGALFWTYRIGSSLTVIFWPNSITISRDVSIFLPGYTEHTETRKLPRKYVIDQGENPVLFLHQKYFPHKSHVHNYIYSLKWRTPRVSHTPPIDSNESLMARTANSFFQNIVGGSNFYFNRPSSEKDRKAEKKNPPACLEVEEIQHMCSLPHLTDLKRIFRLFLKTLQQDKKLIFKRQVVCLTCSFP